VVRFWPASPSYICQRRPSGVGAKLVDLYEDEAGKDGVVAGAGQDGWVAGAREDGSMAGAGQDDMADVHQDAAVVASDGRAE
jgi:hypothetical protein